MKVLFPAQHDRMFISNRTWFEIISFALRLNSGQAPARNASRPPAAMQQLRAGQQRASSRGGPLCFGNVYTSYYGNGCRDALGTFKFSILST